MAAGATRHRAAGAAGLLGSLVLLVAGCTSALTWNPDTYVVRRGDTLYGIAWRHGLDHRRLAAWNGLGDGSLIHPGQRLRLTPPPGRRSAPATTARETPASAPAPRARPPAPQPLPQAAPPADWLWPTEGRVLSAFGQGSLGGKGLDIGGRPGQPVRAASAGQVVYSGSGLIGYGQLIILKHNETYLSAYGHNSKLLVQEGDRVRTGQQIARMGEGPGRRPVLHFEIRQNGKPVDPSRFLPPR